MYKGERKEPSCQTIFNTHFMRRKIGKKFMNKLVAIIYAEQYFIRNPCLTSLALSAKSILSLLMAEMMAKRLCIVLE